MFNIANHTPDILQWNQPDIALTPINELGTQLATMFDDKYQNATIQQDGNDISVAAFILTYVFADVI